MQSYIPKAGEAQWCEWFKLCTVRKDAGWVAKIWVKQVSGEVDQETLATVINADRYDGKAIKRVYASWHVFLSDDLREVYLVTKEKDGTIQHQFTGWSPLEEEFKDVIRKEDGIYRFDIATVRANARLRTKKRTWVIVTDEYNEHPLVDWVLMENKNAETWESYWKLVCLMHFIVKEYTWTLAATGEEYAVSGARYPIENLDNQANIAPNAHLVSRKAVEEVSK